MDTGGLFRQYENDYCSKSTEISRKIQAIQSLGGDQRRAKLQEVERDISAADTTIKSMEYEARSMAPEQAKALLVKVKEYKADLASLKEQLKKAAASMPTGEAARAELGLAGDYYSTSAGQRERMLTATQRQEQSTAMLLGAQTQLAQTEDIAAQVLRDLHSQRETILHSKSTLEATDDNIGKARKILSAMARRALQNKIIMFGVAGFLLIAIIVIIYVSVK